jgi:hypothetical protein
MTIKLNVIGSQLANSAMPSAEKGKKSQKKYIRGRADFYGAGDLIAMTNEISKSSDHHTVLTNMFRTHTRVKHIVCRKSSYLGEFELSTSPDPVNGIEYVNH